jgi:hypothetical protein
LAAALTLPLVAQLPPLERCALTLIALIATIKGSMIATSKPEWLTPGRRVWQVLVPFDVRATRRVAPGLDSHSLQRVGVGGAIAALTMWYAIRYSGHLPPALVLLAELASALVVTYALMEFISETIRSLHRLVGIEVPPLQRDPILSCSVSEFWGERWNLPITRWLNEFFFRPWARRGQAATGTILAFVVSTALHAWLFFAAVGALGGLLAASFFLVQIPAVLVERQLRIRTWPVAVRRAWTLGFLIMTSPLFVWPLVYGLKVQLASR